VRLGATALKVRERIAFPIRAQASRARAFALDGITIDGARREALEREGRALSLEDAVASAVAQARAGA
jgi:hypothetical protein